jgi:hypothetical protein
LTGYVKGDTMHTLLQSHMAHALARTMEDAGHPTTSRPRRRRPVEPVVIRRAHPRDAGALRSLAELDGTRDTRTGLEAALADGDVLLAEIDGAVRAAVPVHGGRIVADPFAPTAGVAELLRMRAGQLRHAA